MGHEMYLGDRKSSIDSKHTQASKAKKRDKNIKSSFKKGPVT